jgi:predicted dehydrogenase
MAADALVIVGCGWIARRHAAAARRLGVPIIFASRDAGRARAYAREFGGIGAFDDYARALGDPRVQGAIVCTPHDRHHADVLAALAAGRHVLVEKPIACTLEEAGRMVEAAARAGRVLMVAENFHFMPAFRHVRALIGAGRLGELRELHLVARAFRRHAGWRIDASAAGGGVLIDVGIHYVHALRWWGAPSGASSRCARRRRWTAWPARTPWTCSPSWRAAWSPSSPILLARMAFPGFNGPRSRVGPEPAFWTTAGVWSRSAVAADRAYACSGAISGATKPC